MLSVEVAAGMIGAAFVVGFAIGFALRSYISNRRRERARARRFGSTWSPPLSFQMDGDERERKRLRETRGIPPFGTGDLDDRFHESCHYRGTHPSSQAPIYA